MNTSEQRFLAKWLPHDPDTKPVLYHFSYFDFNTFPLIQGILGDVAALSDDLAGLDIERVVHHADTLPPVTPEHYPMSSFGEKVQEIHFISAFLKIWLFYYTDRMVDITRYSKVDLERRRRNAEYAIRRFCLGTLAPVPIAEGQKIRHWIKTKYGCQWDLEYGTPAIRQARTELAFIILHEFGLQYQARA